MGMYMKTMVHMKQNPNMNRVFDPSWAMFRNIPPVTIDMNRISTHFKMTTF
jgi:hypothetical protein